MTISLSINFRSKFIKKTKKDFVTSKHIKQCQAKKTTMKKNNLMLTKFMIIIKKHTETKNHNLIMKNQKIITKKMKQKTIKKMIHNKIHFLLKRKLFHVLNVS